MIQKFVPPACLAPSAPALVVSPSPHSVVFPDWRIRGPSGSAAFVSDLECSDNFVNSLCWSENAEAGEQLMGRSLCSSSRSRLLRRLHRVFQLELILLSGPWQGKAPAFWPPWLYLYSLWVLRTFSLALLVQMRITMCRSCWQEKHSIRFTSWRRLLLQSQVSMNKKDKFLQRFPKKGHHKAPRRPIKPQQTRNQVKA